MLTSENPSLIKAICLSDNIGNSYCESRGKVRTYVGLVRYENH